MAVQLAVKIKHLAPAINPRVRPKSDFPPATPKRLELADSRTAAQVNRNGKADVRSFLASRRRSDSWSSGLMKRPRRRTFRAALFGRGL
jgi:hypothetical protein